MDEFRENLWAPWRMEYIHRLVNESDGGCFLCHYRDTPGSDTDHHVVARTPAAMIVLNRFPYTNGHLLVAPLVHKAELDDLDDGEMKAVWWLVRDAKSMLAEAVGAHGFNIGANFGRCAGAGLPGHLHIHVVPRWNGDTNFMPVLGDVRVVPESLDAVAARLRAIAQRRGLAPCGG